MTQDDQKTKTTQNEQATQDSQQDPHAAREGQTTQANTDSTEQNNQTAEEAGEDFNFPGLDENMLGQVQEMMARLERVGELEQENTDLKNKLGRLAADFESYRRRTQEDVAAAEGQGVAKAAERLMPVYDDLERALSMSSSEPAKLIPGVEAVQSTILRIFGQLGLEATGKPGEPFDPRWHEAVQVVSGEEDDVIVQVYQLGFRMGELLVRPARVVVSRKQ
ncbi:nucleotide exchange factor GrpE [Deinococcus sp. DB0503]|uniref:nucleotide exchange factor GrpE n=1 Tax=Deinococcus sp. DB0503 TaxID=2479203 RepID=UPI0018DF1E34|nr:nucleotide exchange factor GrpE [Deinococcus sp. DB0503]MBI0445066.1 nucleotide exchange factor GrpE [Deinococcus sp. DB0503]